MSKFPEAIPKEIPGGPKEDSPGMQCYSDEGELLTSVPLDVLRFLIQQDLVQSPDIEDYEDDEE